MQRPSWLNPRNAEIDRTAHAHPRESIIFALHTLLQTLPATALRGAVLSERVPTAGLLIQRDGEPGEPEVTLSPLGSG